MTDGTQRRVREESRPCSCCGFTGIVFLLAFGGPGGPELLLCALCENRWERTRVDMAVQGLEAITTFPPAQAFGGRWGKP